MAILFTADLQAEWENLDLCAQVRDELSSLISERGVTDLVVAGDLKRHYNPVDIRVTQFWMDFIATVSKVRAGLTLHILLGNHDRVGMYDDAQNWLPILARAGARVYDEPFLSHRHRLAFLPFCSDPKRWKENAQTLARRVAKSDNIVLAFHQELRKSFFNVLRQRAESLCLAADMRPEQYAACIGGHIHHHQMVPGTTNVFYVGSPFATDWGEANQRKGYMLVDSAPGEKPHIQFVDSKIPGWYDPSWPGFPRDKEDWRGCRIRSHVECRTGEDHTRVVEAERRRLEKKYKGAYTVVLPRFVEEEQKDSPQIRLNDPDSVKVRQYVQATLPEANRPLAEPLVSYLAYKIRKAAGKSLRNQRRVCFLRASGRNVLSFARVKLELRHRGLVLVTGVNRDWFGRSNGSGKTNLLQLIPLPMFGATFKGQKFDAWANRWSGKEEAKVRLVLRDFRGRKIEIIRTRHPGSLRLLVNGVDQSSGMQSTSKEGTQGLIEQLCGFTQRTLLNSVYQDQALVTSFLAGTQKERKETLERFLNLERFADALKIVKRDADRHQDYLETLKFDMDACDVQVTEIKKRLAEEPDYGARVRDASATVRKLEARNQQQTTRLEERGVELKRRFQDLRAREKKLEARIAECSNRMGVLNEKMGAMKAQLAKFKKMLARGQCPLCYSPIGTGRFASRVSQLRRDIRSAVSARDRISEEIATARGQLSVVARRVVLAEGDVYRHATGASDLVGRLEKARGYLHGLRVARKKSEKAARGLRRLMRKHRAHGERLRSLYVASLEDVDFYGLAAKALSREGLPNYLIQTLCPQLNGAAAYYAELLTDNHIQVRFSADGDDFNITVTNASGGEGVDDQSAGEKKMAGMICAFALMDVAQPSNVIVLDEPGEGLDPANARMFAAGLKKLREKFESIFLVTHNPHILAELSGETVIVVEKQKGISKIRQV